MGRQICLGDLATKPWARRRCRPSCREKVLDRGKPVGLAFLASRSSPLFEWEAGHAMPCAKRRHRQPRGFSDEAKGAGCLTIERTGAARMTRAVAAG